MLPGKDEWWNDERVDSTVNAHFLWSHLALHGEKLQSRVFSTSFSEDTYLQFILKKTKRLFLILVTVGISSSIFDLVDSSYDDEDLPIAEENLSTLRLPKDRFPNIEQTFYRTQFKYLLRVAREGEHIRYAKSEIVPVQSLQQKPLGSAERSDPVKLPNDRILLRRRISLEESRSEIDVLSEIVASNPLKHEHIISVFASYQHDGYVHILITPSTKQNLKSFLNDLPKPFLALSKTTRRQQLLTWSSCLANALTWLHSQGVNHGAIRPSRILLDDNFQPSLGQFEGNGVLGSPTAKDDLEAYQYGAPEFWRRELTVQGASASRSTSGPRLGRSGSIRQGPMYPSSNSSTSHDGSSLPGAFRTYTFVPTAKGNSSRLKLESVGHQRRISVPHPTRDVESRISSRNEQASDSSKPYSSFYRRFDALSLTSSNSSDNGKRNGSQPSLFFSVPVEDRSTVVVQAWKSTARDLPMADVFALAAVSMDILTVMCSRTTSSFAKHRSSKNRQAGRGGGLADASFHANLSTLPSWAESLHKDAEKKMKKEEGTIFRAVGPTLQVVLQCLEKDPAKRLDSESLAKHLQQHMATFAGISQTHCTPKLAEKKTTPGKQIPKSQNTMQDLMTSDKRQSVVKTPSSGISHDTILLDHLDRGSVVPESFRSHRPSTLNDSEYHPTQMIDEYSLESYDYYDPHPGIRWEANQHRGLSPKPLQVRPRVRIEPSISEREYTRSAASSPPSLSHSRTTATHRSRFESSEPGTPSTYAPSYKHAQYPEYYTERDYLPPDRDLPPVPSNTPMSRRRAGSDPRRQKASPKQPQPQPQPSDVDHATNLLAEAINNQRYMTYEQAERPPRKSSKALYVPQPRYYIEEDYEDDDHEERYAGYDQRAVDIRR